MGLSRHAWGDTCQRDVASPLAPPDAAGRGWEDEAAAVDSRGRCIHICRCRLGGPAQVGAVVVVCCEWRLVAGAARRSRTAVAVVADVAWHVPSLVAPNASSLTPYALPGATRIGCAAGCRIWRRVSWDGSSSAAPCSVRLPLGRYSAVITLVGCGGGGGALDERPRLWFRCGCVGQSQLQALRCISHV